MLVYTVQANEWMGTQYNVLSQDKYILQATGTCDSPTHKSNESRRKRIISDHTRSCQSAVRGHSHYTELTAGNYICCIMYSCVFVYIAN